MPRPTDNYAHGQFEAIESHTLNETVRCIHCRAWTGSGKTLHRKKEHLLRCPQYLAWRAAGNGQDLAPPNRYERKPESIMMNLHNKDGEDDGESEVNNSNVQIGVSSSPAMAGNTSSPGFNLDKYWDEIQEADPSMRGARVRCTSCGFVRVRNPNMQKEHLSTCQEFLNTSEGSTALLAGWIKPPRPRAVPTASTVPTTQTPNRTNMLRGVAPNIGLNGRPPVAPSPYTPPQRSVSRPSVGTTPVAAPVSRTPVNPTPTPGIGISRSAPSLVAHLRKKWPAVFIKATHTQFLERAGSGTLPPLRLGQWLAQNSYVVRGMIAFIGTMIGQVELSDAPDSKLSTPHRTVDLLIAAVSNLRKELDFLQQTRLKYNVPALDDAPAPATKALLDMLAAQSNNGLLEGMVVLWAIENCYSASWQYAGTHVPQVPAATSYSIPAHLSQPSAMNPFPMHNTGTGSPSDPATIAANAATSHNAAIHHALIPNWSSREFGQFVEACRHIVDELANAQTSGSGRQELANCEVQYHQVIWLWEQIWPSAVLEEAQPPPPPATSTTATAIPGHNQEFRTPSGTGRPAHVAPVASMQRAPASAARAAAPTNSQTPPTITASPARMQTAGKAPAGLRPSGFSQSNAIALDDDDEDDSMGDDESDSPDELFGGGGSAEPDADADDDAEIDGISATGAPYVQSSAGLGAVAAAAAKAAGI